MALLSDADTQELQKVFAELTRPVKLVFFTQTLNCETCDAAKQILDEVGKISDKLKVEEHDFILEQDAAASYGINRVPGIAVVSDGTDPGIRFFGAPMGYEFASLLEAIILVGGAEEADLSESSQQLIGAVKEPVSIQVFVTPT